MKKASFGEGTLTVTEGKEVFSMKLQ